MPKFDITIAGELNLDLLLYGLPRELALERELLAERMIVTLGSSSAIVAHNLASLGSRVGFQSRIGDDELGRIALERLAQSGADTSRVRAVPGPTKTGLSVILQQEGGRHILTYAGTIAELTCAELDFGFLADSRHFHLSSYYLQRKLRPDVPGIFKKLKAAGLSVSLDTNDDPADEWQEGIREALRHVDIFLPNSREARKIAGCEDLEAALERLAEIVPVVVIKAGQEGAIAARGKERFRSPATKVEAVDAVGAGDSFDAGFLHEYLRGGDLPACLASGNLAGGFSTTRPGGTEAFRDREYRERFFSG